MFSSHSNATFINDLISKNCMKTVDVAFKRMEVANFDPRQEVVEYRIIFNDGKDRGIQKNGKIEDPQQEATALIKEIREKLKALHNERSLDDDPLANIVMVRSKQDDEELLEKIARFLNSVKERIRVAKLSKLSYADMEKKVKGMTTEF